MDSEEVATYTQEIADYGAILIGFSATTYENKKYNLERRRLFRQMMNDLREEVNKGRKHGA